MTTSVKHLSGRHAPAQFRRRTLGAFGRPTSRAGTCVISRASYDVDVEPIPLRAPSSGPSRFGGSPPPPPPPPPPQKTGLQPPSRREMLFGFLGLGMGVAGTYAYDNRPIDKAEIDERLTELMDELLDDEALLNVLGEEIMLNKNMQDEEDAVRMLKGLEAIEEQLNKVPTVEELEAAAAAAEASGKQ
ncbi:hypothetical protein Agub_g14936 [Astrephomene gubernaculifera]|uniref:Uncharacterized protein n=1 Tax=Astrephomene gubernaculifera TaxID=47775 RepID=A0AAD3E294_9CHLO|nr:hypothetical protein Agub_g14936 [Astrephomene gubernaculifera]